MITGPITFETSFLLVFKIRKSDHFTDALSVEHCPDDGPRETFGGGVTDLADRLGMRYDEKAVRLRQFRRQVAMQKTVSPSNIVCAGRMALAMPSWAIWATFIAWGLFSLASVATRPIVVFWAGAAWGLGGRSTARRPWQPEFLTSLPVRFPRGGRFWGL